MCICYKNSNRCHEDEHDCICGVCSSEAPCKAKEHKCTCHLNIAVKCLATEHKCTCHIAAKCLATEHNCICLPYHTTKCLASKHRCACCDDLGREHASACRSEKHSCICKRRTEKPSDSCRAGDHTNWSMTQWQEKGFNSMVEYEDHLREHADRFCRCYESLNSFGGHNSCKAPDDHVCICNGETVYQGVPDRCWAIEHACRCCNVLDLSLGEFNCRAEKHKCNCCCQKRVVTKDVHGWKLGYKTSFSDSCHAEEHRCRCGISTDDCLSTKHKCMCCYRCSTGQDKLCRAETHCTCKC